MQVLAWSVFTHNSVLGRANPDLVVRNAFGEPYTYALCPSADEVVDYCTTLVSEIVEVAEPDGMVLEACGRLGVEHGGHHDKVDFAEWTAVQKTLLSLCFCRACLRQYSTAGIDAKRLAAVVRTALGEESPETVADALGDDLLQAVTAVVAQTASSLRDRVTAAARASRPELPLTLHAAVDPLATGAFSGLGVPPTEVNAVVTNCWVGGKRAARQVEEMRTYVGPQVAVGGYFRADTLRAPEGPSLEELAEKYVTAGLDELHLYHLGLAPQRRMVDLRHFVSLVSSRNRHPSPT